VATVLLLQATCVPELHCADDAFVAEVHSTSTQRLVEWVADNNGVRNLWQLNCSTL